MKSFFSILFVTLFFNGFSQTNENQKELNYIQKQTFLDLMKLICNPVGDKHTYINKLKSFKMIDDNESYVTSYKYISSDFNYFVTIYNNENGVRFNSPNSFLYENIVDKGTFVEVHKEGATSFLVYKFSEQSFLLNFSTDQKGRKHYIIDSYCANQ